MFLFLVNFGHFVTLSGSLCDVKAAWRLVKMVAAPR